MDELRDTQWHPAHYVTPQDEYHRGYADGHRAGREFQQALYGVGRLLFYLAVMFWLICVYYSKG